MRTPILILALAVCDVALAIRNKYEPEYKPSDQLALFFVIIFIIFMLCDCLEFFGKF